MIRLQNSFAAENVREALTEEDGSLFKNIMSYRTKRDIESTDRYTDRNLGHIAFWMETVRITNYKFRKKHAQLGQIVVVDCRKKSSSQLWGEKPTRVSSRHLNEFSLLLCRHPGDPP